MAARTTAAAATPKDPIQEPVVEYEPCPYCAGTGRRVKAPPPLTRGGRRRGVRRHGTPSTYSNGCRCDLCRAAWREDARRRSERRRADS